MVLLRVCVICIIIESLFCPAPAELSYFIHYIYIELIIIIIILNIYHVPSFTTFTPKAKPIALYIYNSITTCFLSSSPPRKDCLPRKPSYSYSFLLPQISMPSYAVLMSEQINWLILNMWSLAGLNNPWV